MCSGVRKRVQALNTAELLGQRGRTTPPACAHPLAHLPCSPCVKSALPSSGFGLLRARNSVCPRNDGNINKSNDSYSPLLFPLVLT